MNREKIKNIIASFKGKKIAVIGDMILDVYIWGSATRISQEAPVPVVCARKKTMSLGGAANVMRNISSLGGTAIAFGAVGTDDNGDRLLSLLDESSIVSNYVKRSSDRETIEKQRIIAGNQQLLRIDYEKNEAFASDIRNKIISEISEMLKHKELDAILFEDYAKGLIGEEMVLKILAVANETGIPVGLDPHPSHLINAKGFAFATPNRAEAYALSGTYYRDSIGSDEKDEQLRQVARKLIEIWDTKNLLITLGADGMAVYDRNHECVKIPTMAKEVYDVTGAGDTVIAAFALAMLGGAKPYEAAEIANHAAGIVVGKIGTAAVSSEELIESF